MAERLSALRELGLDSLADRIVKRLASSYTAVITAEGERFAVKTSYEVAQEARLNRVAGRQWDSERKVNTFPLQAKRAVFAALQDAHAGSRCLGPKGEFTL